jgi:hypothetical protein
MRSSCPHFWLWEVQDFCQEVREVASTELQVIEGSNGHHSLAVKYFMINICTFNIILLHSNYSMYIIMCNYSVNNFIGLGNKKKSWDSLYCVLALLLWSGTNLQYVYICPYSSEAVAKTIESHEIDLCWAQAGSNYDPPGLCLLSK